MNMSGVNGKTPSDRPAKSWVGSETRLKNVGKRNYDAIQLYLKDIEANPLLSPKEELYYGRLVKKGDELARKKMIVCNLRLVVKISRRYLNRGLSLSDLIEEGNLGLIHAVEKFDPERGFRLATYAMWWIRASIQEYILRSWSLVKMGTTSAQKKLFFNLRKIKNKIGAIEEGELRPENVQKIATDLNVTEAEVISMNRRMSGGDASLNAPLNTDGEGAAEWQDWLEDEDADQATAYAEKDEMDARRDLLMSAMTGLNERERHILSERKLKDEPKTLEELSEVYGVSRERIRQIEVRAFEKLQKSMREMAVERGMVHSVN